MEETINWLDSGIVCAARQERRKEGMPPGMFGSLKKEDIEKVKEILEPVHIGSQIPYGSGVVRINLTINGDQYLCWDGIIQSENPYNTKWDVTWKLDGDYGDTGYLERLEELYWTYDTAQ